MNPFEPVPAIHGEVEAGRSRAVREALENLKQQISDVNLTMGELLDEAVEKGYLSDWGYTGLGDYAEKVLDIKERQATYLIRITRVSRSLGITRDRLENIGISKLKEIFSLDPNGVWNNPETQLNEPLNEHISRLLALAPSVGLEAIKAEVKMLKGLVGGNELTWTNFQTSRDDKENIILPAMAKLRQVMGSKGITDPITGNSEYSDGFVFLMLMAEVNNGTAVEVLFQPGGDEISVEPEIEDEVVYEEV